MRNGFLASSLLTMLLMCFGMMNLGGCPKKTTMQPTDRMVVENMAVSAKARAVQFERDRENIAAANPDEGDAVKKWAKAFSEGLAKRAKNLADLHKNAAEGKLDEVDIEAVGALIQNICADEIGFRHMLPSLTHGPGMSDGQWTDFADTMKEGLATVKASAMNLAARMRAEAEARAKKKGESDKSENKTGPPESEPKGE